MEFVDRRIARAGAVVAAVSMVLAIYAGDVRLAAAWSFGLAMTTFLSMDRRERLKAEAAKPTHVYVTEIQQTRTWLDAALLKRTGRPCHGPGCTTIIVGSADVTMCPMCQPAPAPVVPLRAG